MVVIMTAFGTAHGGEGRRRRGRSRARAVASVGNMNTHDDPREIPLDLPAPDRPLGPPGLGLQIGPSVADPDSGGAWCALLASPGLDGPPGILQGGLAAGLTVELAHEHDRFGAPLHALTARLEAPTLLGVPFAAYVASSDVAGWYDVETWQNGRRLVRATVELTGTDPLGALPELVALAEGPPPAPDPDPVYESCFVCGRAATHPLALRTPPAFVAPGQLSVPWIPDERLARDDTGRVSSLLVAAALDCPSAWATMGEVRRIGYRAALLGSLRLQVAGDVEVLDPVRVTGLFDGADGRKMRARSAIVDTDGTVLAMVDAVHIAVSDLPTPGS
jgi:hypothetical protein